MPELLPPIRIRIMLRGEDEQSRRDGSPRSAFWAPALSATSETEKSENARISVFEGELERHFGTTLRERLIHHLQEPISRADNNLSHAIDVWHRSARGSSRQVDEFGRFLTERAKLISDSQELSHAHKRIAAARSVFFVVHVAGYSSLNLDLMAGPIENLVQVFDSNFETFRMFLEAFVPQTTEYGGLPREMRDRCQYTITIPPAWQTAFARAAAPVPSAPPSVGTPTVPVVGTTLPVAPIDSVSVPSVERREKAEWLWKLANGSLLVPFLLAIIVMWYGLRTLSDIHREHRGAVQPILEHQLQLLQEDRHRLATVTGHREASAVAAAIDDTYYTGSGDPNLRTEVLVSGSYFNTTGSPSTTDCETRLPNHPVLDQRAWKSCREIKSRSGTLYHVVAEHGAAFELVEVRVRGTDGGWSDGRTIRK